MYKPVLCLKQIITLNLYVDKALIIIRIYLPCHQEKVCYTFLLMSYLPINEFMFN